MSFTLLIFLPIGHQPRSGDLSIVRTREAAPAQKGVWGFFGREDAEPFASSYPRLAFTRF
jgi:hypothetical protein